MYYQDLGWQQFCMPPALEPASPLPGRVTLPDRSGAGAPPPPLPSGPSNQFLNDNSDEAELPTYKEAISQAEDTVVSVHRPEENNRTTSDV